MAFMFVDPNEVEPITVPMLDDNGIMLLRPASFYKQFDHVSLIHWCVEHGRYGIVTEELVGWLKRFIGDRSCIEIGAGSGDLCHHMGIKGTDSYLMDDPRAKSYYAALRQPTTTYGKHVERIEAYAAVRKYKPDVVLASWVTRWIDPNKPPPIGGGSIYGIKEDKLIRHVKEYIVVGNDDVHKHKKLFRTHEHSVSRADWLVSRAFKQEMNAIYVFKGDR